LTAVPRIQRAVLEVLLDGRTHAYEVKRRLAPSVGHSSVYAALARAEAKGYVSSEWEDITARPPGSGPPRKYYEITALGVGAVREAQTEPASVARTQIPGGMLT